MSFGTLKLARRPRRKSCTAAGDSAASGSGSMQANSRSPNSSSGMPNTAQSRTPCHADQRVLDFGRIDVDAARDHHVALAVAQEQIAVGVEVADVADADEAVAAGFARAPRPCRDSRNPDTAICRMKISPGSLTSHGSPSGRKIFDDAAFDRRGRRCRVSPAPPGRMPHRNAGFGRAEIFVDHRAPPVDHRALDLRRAGRRAMDDEAQRRQVVTALSLRPAAAAAARTWSAPCACG